MFVGRISSLEVEPLGGELGTTKDMSGYPKWFARYLLSEFRLIAVKNSHFSLLQASKLETPKLHRWALFGISEYLVVPFTEFWSQCPR